MKEFLESYDQVRSGKLGCYKHRRGLLEVSGGEAIQFLNGLITNDVAKLGDGEMMRAAFPTLKGRMFAVVRILLVGEKFLFETEETTRQKVYDNLFRFTYAGDFHVADVSDNYEFYSIFGGESLISKSDNDVVKFENDFAVPKESVEDFEGGLPDAVWINDELYEVLRIESGIPKYDVDMDEETVVPEVGFDDMISYEKGCYIGQEVIARIHFRGKVAKELAGLVFENDDIEPNPGDEILSVDGKSAGKITSVVFSPKLEKVIALAYVRNAFLDEGTELKVGESLARVSKLPFLIKRNLQ